MSQNVPKTKESKALIVLPQKDEKVVNSKHETNWDEIAGVTGALEGNDRNVIRLKPIQNRAISLLLQGKSQIDVANEIGVTRKSVSRWMKIGTVFRELLMEKQHALWEATDQKLKNLHMKAAHVFAELLESPDEKIRLQAAAIVFRQIKIIEPFNPNEIPEDLVDEYEARRANNEYYVDTSPCLGESGIPRELSWERSEHSEKFEFLDHSQPELRSFTIRPDEIESFAKQLEGKAPNITINQDVIYVRNHRNDIMAEIYSIRAERRSVFQVKNFNRGEFFWISSDLNIETPYSYDGSQFDERVIIPKDTTPEDLIAQLSRAGHFPRKSRKEDVADCD